MTKPTQPPINPITKQPFSVDKKSYDLAKDFLVDFRDTEGLGFKELDVWLGAQAIQDAIEGVIADVRHEQGEGETP